MIVENHSISYFETLVYHSLKAAIPLHKIYEGYNLLALIQVITSIKTRL